MRAPVVTGKSSSSSPCAVVERDFCYGQLNIFSTVCQSYRSTAPAHNHYLCAERQTPHHSRHSRSLCRFVQISQHLSFPSLVPGTIHQIIQNMAPSPKPNDRKHPFGRTHLIAFFLGCFFFLLLWHGFGRSRDPEFDHELRGKIKVHHCFPDSFSRIKSSRINYNPLSRLSQSSKAQQA